MREEGLAHVDQEREVGASVEQMAVHVRWMIRRDMPEVLEIEHGVESPWTEEDYCNALRKSDRIGLVAEQKERIVGCVVYGVHKRFLTVERLVVHQDHRRCRVGRQLVEKLVSKLSPRNKRHLQAVVEGRNLDAQLFLQALGWRCERTLKDGDEERLLFALRPDWKEGEE